MKLLVKLAKELNKDIKSIVNVLSEHGYIVSPKPTTKISDETASVLYKVFNFAPSPNTSSAQETKKEIAVSVVKTPKIPSVNNSGLKISDSNKKTTGSKTFNKAKTIEKLKPKKASKPKSKKVKKIIRASKVSFKSLAPKNPKTRGGFSGRLRPVKK